MALTALKGPATAAVLHCFLLMYHLNPALAATAASDDNSDSDSYRFSTDFVSYPRPDPPEERKGQQWIFGWLIMGAFAVLVFKCSTYGRSTVIKLQVGVSGAARTLQKDLDQIPKHDYARFPQKDLSRVLTGATAALLRHSHDCISGYSSVATIQNIVHTVKYFSRIELEERAKFDKETLVGLNNIKRKSSTERPGGLQNEFLVVTLIVVVKGKHKFLTINNNTDLTKALQNLGSIPSSNLIAVRVLWTPQQENDTLSEQELLEDYPLLKTF